MNKSMNDKDVIQTKSCDISVKRQAEIPSTYFTQAGNDDPFVELERKTNDYLAKVRQEACRIVEEARVDVARLKKETLSAIGDEQKKLEQEYSKLEETRRQIEEKTASLEERYALLEQEAFENARNEGFRQGLTEGSDEGYRQGIERANAELETRVSESVEQKVQEACKDVLIPLNKLIQEMKGTRQELLKNWEENIMQIAAAIAYQTIMREPAIMREAPLDLLREALELAMNCATLKIRMNPRDVDNLDDQIRAILEETGNLAKSEVVSDPKITQGGCLVESSLGVVDERLESRLERIIAELSE